MPEIVVVVLGVSGLLALVSFLPPLAARLRMPYTVVLAAAGVALGAALNLAETRTLGLAGGFLSSLGELDLHSETLLYIFLPVLLFETALAIDVRRLMDDIGPILLLAVVAVFVTTFAIGFALQWVTPFGLVSCLLLGSILATTDPAAVVGIFRDLGAPRRLTMLVEGESLLNDAAAIALFTLLVEMLIHPGTTDAGEAALQFVLKFAGGVAMGYLCGRLACVLVAPVQDQPMAEITLTVALAYLSYVLAEQYAHASGVVAVVVAALVVGSVGRTRISPNTWEALEHVWKQLGFWANSLIFLLTAMAVPALWRQIGWAEVGWLAVVVVVALAARAVVLFGLLPILSALSLAHRVSHAYKTVMLWGGLRGAISLTLAWALTEKAGVPEEVQDFVAVVASGYVFFTLFVNGATLRWVIHLLGLDRLTTVERAMRNRALALALDGIREKVGEVARTYEMDEAAAAGLTRLYAERERTIDRERTMEAMLSEADRIKIGLVILANREEEMYYAHFKQGVLPRNVVEILAGRGAKMHDAVKSQGREGYLGAEESIIAFSAWMRWASWLHRHFGIQRPLSRRLALRFEVLVAVRMVLRELTEFSQTRLSEVLGADIACELEGLLAVRLSHVEAALEALRLQYPDYAITLQSRYLGRAALRLEEADYRTLHAESVITAEVLDHLERELSQRRRALETPPRLDLRLDLKRLVARVPIFAGVPHDRLEIVVRLLKPRLVLPGEMIVRRGERGDAMFFIASGAVEVVVPGLEHPVKLGTGDFFGEMALLSRQRRNADVRALGYCQLLALHEKDFSRHILGDADLGAHIRAVAESRRQPAPAVSAAEA